MQYKAAVELAREIILAWRGPESAHFVVVSPLSDDQCLLNQLANPQWALSNEAANHAVAICRKGTYASADELVEIARRAWGISPRSSAEKMGYQEALELAVRQIRESGRKPILILPDFHNVVKRLPEELGACLQELHDHEGLMLVVEIPISWRNLVERLRDKQGDPCFLNSDFGRGFATKVLFSYTIEEVETEISRYGLQKDHTKAVWELTGGLPLLVQTVARESGAGKSAGYSTKNHDPRFLCACDPLLKDLSGGQQEALARIFLGIHSENDRAAFRHHEWENLLFRPDGQLKASLVGEACTARSHINGGDVAVRQPRPSVANSLSDVGSAVCSKSRYELRCRLCAGGMAEAFKAHDHETDRTVFLKRVLRASTDRAALEREARIYSRLAYENTHHSLKILEYFPDNEYVTLVTEFADGGDLSDYVNQQEAKKLTVSQAKETGICIAQALKELHGLNIVHRDLKPGNVLLCGGCWKLADFGISKNQDQFMTQRTFQKSGTLGYAAPEQLNGVEARPSADIYSFGKILIFLLTGQTDLDVVLYRNWRGLIEQCINKEDPTQRPGIRVVIDELEKMAV